MVSSDLLTDFAEEAFEPEMIKAHKIESISVDEIVVTPKLSQILGKPEGHYFVLAFAREKLNKEHLAKAMHTCASSLINFSEGDKAMVIGLGNDMLSADSFGAACAKQVDAYAKRIYSITPGVEGKTGIDSQDYIQIMSDFASPDKLILLDALYTNTPLRMLESIQISNVPLAAGSGIGKKRDSLKSLPKAKSAISIGYTTTAGMSVPSDHSGEDMTIAVTPADCDAFVNIVSEITAEVINLLLKPITKGLASIA